MSGKELFPRKIFGEYGFNGIEFESIEQIYKLENAFLNSNDGETRREYLDSLIVSLVNIVGKKDFSPMIKSNLLVKAFYMYYRGTEEDDLPSFSVDDVNLLRVICKNAIGYRKYFSNFLKYRDEEQEFRSKNRRVLAELKECVDFMYYEDFEFDGKNLRFQLEYLGVLDEKSEIRKIGEKKLVSIIFP